MNKIIDSKGKLFGKINIIDLGIIIVLIILVLSAFIKFDKTEGQMSYDKTIEYTLKISQIRQPSVDALKKNTKELICPENDKALGEIKDIKIEKAKEITGLVDGTYKMSEFEDKYDVFLTMNVQGTETEDNYYTHTGQKLIVGETIAVNNDYVTSYAVVQDVKVINQ